MDAMSLILLIIGLGLLTFGADVLVRGASRLAVTIGISPLVVGLTVVSLGTSSPELAVGVQSALAGEADIALGNVIGSNIFNVLFVLGLCAVIIPLHVSYQLIRLDVPILIGISVLMLVLSLDGLIGRLDGVLLTVGLVVYTGFTIWHSRREQAEEQTAEEPGESEGGLRQTAWNIGLVVVGLSLLVLGANWLVTGAVNIAEAFGVSSLVIGLTIVAVGTSMPEVATSVVAAIRGERDMAVGNAIGSSIFNILAILGITSVVSPDGINVAQSAISFDIPVMIAVAAVCFPIFFTGYQISRWEGGVLFGYYIIYMLFLVFTAVDHDALWMLSTTMIYVVPVTIVTLIVLGIRAWFRNNQQLAPSEPT